jgi:hypothetical protein
VHAANAVDESELQPQQPLPRVGRLLQRFVEGSPEADSESRRALRVATSINFRGSDGRSNYEALIASVESGRLRNWGLRFTARYTYAQSSDNLSSTFSESGNNFNLGYTDPFNPNLDYGSSDADVRHRLVASWTWEVPAPNVTNRVGQYLVRGWEVTGIFQARAGFPFTVFDCTDGQQSCPRVNLDGAVSLNGSVGHDAVGVSDTPNRYKYIDLSGLHRGAFVDQFGFGRTWTVPGQHVQPERIPRPRLVEHGWSVVQEPAAN